MRSKLCGAYSMRTRGATLDDLREAVTTLEETARTARACLAARTRLQRGLRSHQKDARAALLARETAVGGFEVLQTADDLAAYFGGS